ncbi:MAG: glycosyltransferase [Candidatus Omnitrophica bacterium]|nr:glycosyltransferase [Candidatus Omnitrophota bacterium]
MKTKLIIVIDHLGIGGAQQQILEYLKFANRNVYDIKIVNLDETYNLLGHKISDLGYEIISFRHKGFFNARTLIDMIRLFKKEKPQIVHTYLFTADCYGRLAAKIAGIKNIICSIRDRNLWMKPHHIFADRILSWFTDVITVNAESLRTFLIRERKLDSKKIVTIYNGMDTKRFEHLSHPQELRKDLGIPEDALIVGMVARFSLQKDYETFFAAAVGVSGLMKNVYFLAIGDGKKKAELEQYVKKQGIPNIIFTGVRKDMPDLSNMIDVGVLSTHYEGCPNVILEYMACSKPVVATNVDGCQELIINNKTGFFVPESNPQFMAEKLIQLLNNKELRTRMGQAGYNRVRKHFSSQKLAQNTEDLYQQLLKPKVAFIVSSFPRYSETFILRELAQLKKSGLNFIIYSIKTPKDEIIHEEAKGLIDITHYLPFISLKVIAINLFYFIRYPIRYITAFTVVFFGNIASPNFFLKTMIAWPKTIGFAWLTKKQKITHVHGQWATYPATIAFVISKVNRILFSFTGHAHDIYLDTTMLAEKMHYARFITTCTADNKRRLLDVVQNRNKRHFEPKKIIINYHGIDISRLVPRKKIKEDGGIFRILSVGSLLECKGFKYLIDACKILKERGFSFKCTIAGGGKLEEELKAQVDSLNLKDNVEITGYVTQERLIPIYRQADVFVLSMVPEIHWGIPNVLMEAIAAGASVICTMLPSLPELIKDGETGLIIPEKNSAMIADAIEKLYHDNKLREKLLVSAQRIVKEKFDVINNAAQLRNLFMGSL